MKTKNILLAFFTCAFFLGISSLNAQTKIYIHKTDGTSDEYNIADVDSISFNPPANQVDYSKLKINEVNGVGDDSEKFYELINTGTEDISLAGCQLTYNANSSTGGAFPPTGNQGVTWTGNSNQVIKAGELFTLLGRNTAGSFTTGLTAARILIITLKDPSGNVLDQCVRAKDTDDYAITDKSFSRIPDGTGPFYFTTPTPDMPNGTDADGLTELPVTP